MKNAPTATPWCSISVAGGTASTAGVQTVCVPTGATTLTATPNVGFVLDPTGTWHDTDGDTGSGDMGTISGNTSTTTVTVNTAGTKCVWACCPGSNNLPPCPTTDQCP